MSPLSLSLIVNASFSLLAGLLMVQLFVWFFRVETDRWKLFLLGLPFWKMIYDVARGVPADSILSGGVDPFVLPPAHQMFSLGAGLSPWGPMLTGIFTVNDLRGQKYVASVGDYVSVWLLRHVGVTGLDALVVGMTMISVVLLARRAVQAFRFERRRRLARSAGETLGTLRDGWRAVDVYVSPAHEGTPFTGGLLRPYVCLPSSSVAVLSESELAAVVAHEMGHVRRFDLVGTLFVQLLGDLFWFVPGYRWLSRRIDRLRELLADRTAIQHGADPLQLASALLKLKEVTDPNGGVLYSAFFRERSLLRQRVRTLLGESPDRRPRFGWSYLAVRAFATAWAIGGVLVTTFGGYQAFGG